MYIIIRTWCIYKNPNSKLGPSFFFLFFILFRNFVQFLTSTYREFSTLACSIGGMQRTCSFLPLFLLSQLSREEKGKGIKPSTPNKFNRNIKQIKDTKAKRISLRLPDELQEFELNVRSPQNSLFFMNNYYPWTGGVSSCKGFSSLKLWVRRFDDTNKWVNCVKMDIIREIQWQSVVAHIQGPRYESFSRGFLFCWDFFFNLNLRIQII